MKHIFKYLIAAVLAVAVCPQASAGNATFYSKATAKTSDSSRGKVYISSSAATPVYADESEASQNKQESGSTSKPTSGVHQYYLYAQPEAGFDFYQWRNGDNVVGTSSECVVELTAKSEDSNAPTTAEYTAHFIVHPQVAVKCDNYGTAYIDKPENAIGDRVTITAEPIFNKSTTSIFPADIPNRALAFAGWYDENGNLFSKEQNYTFEIDKEMTLTAKFEISGITTAAGYYRVYTGWNAALRVSGDFTVNVTGQEQFYGDLDLIRNPEGRGYGYSNHKASCRYNGDPHLNIYSDPGTVMYVTGVLNQPNSESYQSGKEVLTKAVITGQGVGTNTFLGNNEVKVKWHANLGYYTVYSSVAALKFQENADRWAGGDVLYPGRDDNSSQTMLRFDALTEANADRNWFGMFPYEEMEFDGGYWTSLYTSFPYKAYEPDGVEVYIIENVSEAAGENIAVLRKIESGVVPANTGVLLKCRDLIDTSSYVSFNEKGQSTIAQGNARMPEPANRLIPLMPDDPMINSADFEGNMLKGSLQLNHAYPDKNVPDKDLGHEKFDEATMRVFSANEAGELGFFKLSADTELAPNRAYLDVAAMPAEQRVKGFRLVMADEAGIVNVPSASDLYDGKAEYFTLQGVKVANPEAGRIYVVRRGSKVTKELIH